MLNFSRNDRPLDARDPGKPAQKPVTYGSNATPNATASTARPATPAAPQAPTPEPAAAAPATPAPASAPGAPASKTMAVSEMEGSKLCVGQNIKLKGVEISDCDIIVIEGQVDATVNSKGMEIARPGTLKGTAAIDVAEIHGDFSGELTARAMLVVHGTGRVTGTIRYGKLIVEEGGEISGDLRRLDATELSSDAPSAPAASQRGPSTESREQRPLLSPQAVR